MFKIYDNQMYTIPFPDGAKPLDIFVSSMDKERVTAKIEGVDGLIDYGSTFNERNIELKMLLVSKDTRDYRLLRDKVNSIFSKTDTLYVSEEHQRGKVYKISVDESFIPERIEGNQYYATATINCRTVGLPFAQSIGTTEDIDKDGITSESELWGFGMGLMSEDHSLNYTHEIMSGETFEIYNAGNVIVHPFHQDLKIEITGVTTNESFTLTNETNGTNFQYNGILRTVDKVVIDGPMITINGLQDLRNSSKTYIQISEGWNTFSIKGTPSAKVKFIFRFYYK